MLLAHADCSSQADDGQCGRLDGAERQLIELILARLLVQKRHLCTYPTTPSVSLLHCISFKPNWAADTKTRLTALCPGLPGWAGTRKVKPIWILLKQETVSGSGIRWVICKSAPRSRQITTPTPHHSVFLQAGCPSCHPTNSVKALKAILGSRPMRITQAWFYRPDFPR